jgi:hypothetical protein
MQKQLAMTAVAIGALASAGFASQSSAAPSLIRAAGTQSPTEPHLFAIRGLGGCELDMVIGLSSDNITPQAALRYQVLSDGRPIAGQILKADTRGAKPGFGNLDAFVSPSHVSQSFSIQAIDQAGNRSAPSNAISRRVAGPC